MANSSSVDKVSINKKLVDNLLNDLRNLSNEAKRKYVAVKEAAENGIIKVRTAATKSEDFIHILTEESCDILHPLVLGCDTKNPRMVQLCVLTMQRLISHEAINVQSSTLIINSLWSLMESGVEELKLLQTIALLLTTNGIVQGDSLARGIVLCFRLYFAKDTITVNTASATVRQLVDLVFDRCVQESSRFPSANQCEVNFEELKICGPNAPKSLGPCAADAYMLFQDLVQLVNADQPFWLNGLTEMTRTFGLELVESALLKYPHIFFKYREFSFLLKERVCPLAIKLFSPNIKYRQGVSISSPQSQPAPLDKPYFPISLRLLRVVSILIQKYYSLLITESEIFLSLVVKFLDVDKPNWQRCLALEVLFKLVAQPELIKSFCECYDMKPHSTKIFYEILHSLDAYILSLFTTPQTNQVSTTTAGVNLVQTQGTPPALLAGMPVGPGVTPQPAFMYRGVWIPLNSNVSTTMNKCAHLDMLDKLEPPPIPDGYGISLAYSCLLEIIRSINSLIEDQEPPDTALQQQLITSSWCGLLKALFLLLEASTDETATENILKAVQLYTNLSGRLSMSVARDAFITSLCKASLPPHYTLTVLNTNKSETNANIGYTRQTSHDAGTTINMGQYIGESEVRQQVVAVGTPLPTASLPIGAQQGPVVLTSKNLQCMRSILGLAHCHGIVLGTAWHLILTTLQHLVWILGLKPSTGGSLKAGRVADTPNAVITTAVMADLPVLSSMLSRLFESSQYLDDVALHHLIDALCKLSQESMELAYTNREPSLFAVAKLLETGLVNLSRVEVLWRPITNHLLEVSQHPHIKMREWGAEAVTMLVKSALSHKYETSLKQNQKLQTMLLLPLQELSNTSHPDIRQKQLECVLQILHNNGDSLTVGWPHVLEIIGAISDAHSENLIRIAFQCLQLVVTDFLQPMPRSCLQMCVDTGAKFGSQNQELNISLTAIGLLWNISDYFFQNEERIRQVLESENTSQASSMSVFDQLWMCLFSRLGDLCVDSRPAVRKSAGQTLFSTISAHGSLLAKSTWQSVLWQVLFPLLDRVRALSGSASTDKTDMGGNILIHHSRNTAQKQWAETQVLTLSGVARVFNTKRDVLLHLGDFPRAWALLLEFIETAALSKNNEVSLAALKSFQEILQMSKTNDEKKEKGTNSKTTSANMKRNDLPDDIALWTTAWKVWYNIGVESTKPPDSNSSDIQQQQQQQILYVPSQPFLTALVQIFPALFHHIRPRFVAADFQKMSTVFQNAVAIPVHGEASPFIVPTMTDITLTPLQECILHTMEILQKEMLSSSEIQPNMLPLLFNQLLIFVGYACQAPSYGRLETKCVTTVKTVSKDWVTMNYVPFAERALEMVLAAYQQTASHPGVISARVLQNIIKTLQLPLSLKYKCPSQTTWKLAITCLLNVLKVGLNVARQNEKDFESMWNDLALALEEFLFSNSVSAPCQSLEEQQMDEAVDCKVIQVIRDDILPFSNSLPKEFILKIMSLLNRGSIHSATSVTDSSRKLREEFAKSCFETLLQFSFIGSKHVVEADDTVMSKLAVTSLLQRFEEVIKKFVEDERLNGKCPLPRHRMAEISFVLKAISTLTSSLKKAPPDSVDSGTWTQLISLYPHLVDCTTSTSSQVCRSLKEALHEYKELLSCPSSIMHNGIAF